MGVLGTERVNQTLFKEYEPFCYAVATDVYGDRGPEGNKRFHINLDRTEMLHYTMVGNCAVECRLDLWSRGVNPGRDFLQASVNLLDKVTRPLERVTLANEEHPIRYISSGSYLQFIDNVGNKYLPLMYRAPNGFYGNRLGSFAGSSNKRAEWLNPPLAGLRELLEELIIVNGNNILLPVNLSTCDSTQINKLHRRLNVSKLESNQIEVAESLMKKPLSIVHTQFSDITPTVSNDDLVVSYRGREFTYRGVIIPDAATAALEFRSVYTMNIEGLDDLTLIYGETKLGDNSTDRRIVLFEFKDLHNLRTGSTATPVLEFNLGKRSETIQPVRLGTEDGIVLPTPSLSAMLKLL